MGLAPACHTVKIIIRQDRSGQAPPLQYVVCLNKLSDNSNICFAPPVIRNTRYVNLQSLVRVRVVRRFDPKITKFSIEWRVQIPRHTIKCILSDNYSLFTIHYSLFNWGV